MVYGRQLASGLRRLTACRLHAKLRLAHGFARAFELLVGPLAFPEGVLEDRRQLGHSGHRLLALELEADELLGYRLLVPALELRQLGFEPLDALLRIRIPFRVRRGGFGGEAQRLEALAVSEESCLELTGGRLSPLGPVG